MLVRKLPTTSRLATALNDGQPVWQLTDHLLADVWVALVKLLGDPEKVPETIDHPLRAEMRAKATAAHKQSLKQEYLRRKRGYDAKRTEGVSE
ncbi:hypothetical protein [Mycobacterium sp. 48b]|uniref:hypothetical protein n=1 Tax=Mycobacterium sp. 48b TaxID=3400426 RepID=UPI003AABB8D8